MSALNKKYTTLFQVLNDTDMYLSLRQNLTLNPGQIQALLQSRWVWIVANWKTLQSRFKTLANGNELLENTLDSIDTAVTSYNLGNFKNPLSDITTFRTWNPLLSTLTFAELKLTGDEKILVNEEIQRVQALTIADFLDMLAYLSAASSLAAQSIGLGDPDAAKLLGVALSPKQRSATIADLSQLDDAQEIEKMIQGMIFDLKQNTDKRPDLLAAANANTDPNSTGTINAAYLSAVAIPFEISLEHMAQKYLGDSALFYELVTINNLQPPYLDPVGQKLNLLAPGALNNFIIPDTLRSSMPVGSKVSIGSYKVREETRIVERVTSNGDGTLVVFLSGAQDLSKLQTTQGAFVRVFQPGTVKMGDFILIPLTQGSPNQSAFTPQSDVLKRLDPTLLAFGVDIATDEKDGGFLRDGTGDLLLSFGLENVRQAVLTAVKTTPGELPFHQLHGVEVDAGTTYYGTTDEAALFAQTLRGSLLKDPRYTDIQIAALSATNSGIALTLLVSIQGQSNAIPLSFVS